MAAVTRVPPLNFAGELPDSARSAIQAVLEAEPKGTRKVYAALARKVWSLLVERRFDDELRDWHELIHGVKSHIRAADAVAAERLAALADLLRESISLAQTSPACAVAARPRARRILEVLETARGFIARRVLLEELAIGNSHLSNVLTQLVAHDLVDRRDRGKEAEFRITALGRQLIGADGRREIETPVHAVREAHAEPSGGTRTGDAPMLSDRLRNPERAQDALMAALAVRVQDAAVEELSLPRDKHLLWPGTVIDFGAFPVVDHKLGSVGVIYHEGSPYDMMGDLGRAPAVLGADLARRTITGTVRRHVTLSRPR